MTKTFSSSKQRLLFILSLMTSTLVLDQVTKKLTREYLSSTSPLSYLGGIVTLQHSENPGAFLSLGSGLQDGSRFWIFTVAVALFLLGALVSLIRKSKLDFTSTLSLSLVIGGGIGNLIDRILQGSVTDFLYLGIGPLHTGVFNVADMAITGGVIAMIMYSFWGGPTVND